MSYSGRKSTNNNLVMLSTVFTVDNYSPVDNLSTVDKYSPVNNVSTVDNIMNEQRYFLRLYNNKFSTNFTKY